MMTAKQQEFIFRFLPEGFTVYTKLDEGNGGCPFCDKTRMHFKEVLDEPFNEVKLNTEERKMMYGILDNKITTVPIIIHKIGDYARLVGGYSELIKE